jgi:hypothetical protein
MNNKDTEKVITLINNHARLYNVSEKERLILLKYHTSLTDFLRRML